MPNASNLTRWKMKMFLMPCLKVVPEIFLYDLNEYKRELSIKGILMLLDYLLLLRDGWRVSWKTGKVMQYFGGGGDGGALKDSKSEHSSTS